jgi:hypothetical protein
MRPLLETVSDYCKQSLLATLGSTLGAAALLLLCWFIGGLILPNISALTYQRLLWAHPFPIQVMTASGLGFFVSHRIKGNRFAIWLWILPALVLAFDCVTWHAASAVSPESAATHFFGSDWISLPTSPQRTQLAVGQFSRTVALYTSLAYGVGSVLHIALYGRGQLVSAR